MPCMLDAIDLVAIRTLSLDIDPRSDQIYFNRGSKVVQDFSETTRAAAFLALRFIAFTTEKIKGIISSRCCVILAAEVGLEVAGFTH